MERERRNAEEVRSILENAKLELKDLLPVGQEIVFDANFSGPDLRLIELDNEVTESIQLGTRLVLRGNGDDSAVLCTDTATFELKDVETSNSLLVLEQLSFPEEAQTSPTGNSKTGSPSTISRSVSASTHDIDQAGLSTNDIMEVDSALCTSSEAEAEGQFIETRSILHIAHSYLELRKVKPNLGRLQQILTPSSYKGPSNETEISGESQKEMGEPITFESLLDKVPASREEIERYIESKMRAFVLEGSIRLADNGYLFQVVSQVLNCIDAFSWEKENIVKRLVVLELGSLQPEFVLEKVFEWFFTLQEPDPETADPEAEDLYCMKELEICRFIGETILRSGRSFILDDFLLAWSESVPAGLKIDLKQLQGVALTDVQNVPSVIWYFSEDNLPETIPDRFAILFETKSKWRIDEIMPYVQELVVSHQMAGTLLTKYARVHTASGVKYYSAKHSK